MFRKVPARSALAANTQVSTLLLTTLVGSVAIGSFTHLGQSSREALVGESVSAAMTIERPSVGSRSEAGLAGAAVDIAQASRRFVELTAGKYQDVPLKAQRFDDVEDFTPKFVKAVEQVADGRPKYEVARTLGDTEAARLVADAIEDVYRSTGFISPNELDKLDTVNATGAVAYLDTLLEAVSRGDEDIFRAKIQRALDAPVSQEERAFETSMRIAAIRDIFDRGITRADREDYFSGVTLKPSELGELESLYATFKNDDLRKLFAAYDDEASQQLYRQLLLPYLRPEIAQNIGARAEQGIILHGPPRTGKTYLAERVARHITSEEKIVKIKGSELDEGVVGGTKEKFNELFNKAAEEATAEEPYVLIFDELDGVIPQDPRGLSGGSQSRRSAFLSAMADAVDKNPNVIVIGTTNRLNDLDPALRGPGRFATEVRIGYPQEAGRQAIINRALDGTEHDIDLDYAVRRLAGYNIADIMSVLAEARRNVLEDFAMGTERPERLVQADFDQARSIIEPTALRANTIDVNPNVRFDDVGGYEAQIAQLTEDVLVPLTQPERYTRLGAEAQVASALLHGPPGSGKTLVANALANEADARIMAVNASDLMTADDVKDLFERARNAQPAIIFLDEVDAVAPRRGAGFTPRDTVVNQILTEMQGLKDRANIAVIATTNRKDLLDPAFLRRMGTQVYMPIVDDATVRSQILNVQTRDLLLAQGADAPDLAAIAARTSNYSGADLKRLVSRATQNAANRDADAVSKADFDEALERVRPSISREEAKSYLPEDAKADFPVGFTAQN